jgi:hypothetical protein
MTPALLAACEDAVHVVTADGRTLRAGLACLFIIDQIGYHRLALLCSLPPFLWLVELGYSFVSHTRGRIGRFLFLGETPLPRVIVDSSTSRVDR